MTRGQELASEVFEKLPGESLGKSHYDLIAQTIDFAIGGERERCAKIADCRANVWNEAVAGDAHGDCSMSLAEECEDIAASIRGDHGQHEDKK